MAQKCPLTSDKLAIQDRQCMVKYINIINLKVSNSKLYQMRIYFLLSVCILLVIKQPACWINMNASLVLFKFFFKHYIKQQHSSKAKKKKQKKNYFVSNVLHTRLLISETQKGQTKDCKERKYFKVQMLKVINELQILLRRRI